MSNSGGNQTVIPLTGAPETIYASGIVANAVATATIPATAGKTGYLNGFTVTAGPATALSTVTFSITGLNGGTAAYAFTFPATATAGAGAATMEIEFLTPIPASAVNTAIVASLPAGGAGNAAASVVLHGYVQ